MFSQATLLMELEIGFVLERVFNFRWFCQITGFDPILFKWYTQNSNTYSKLSQNYSYFISHQLYVA